MKNIGFEVIEKSVSLEEESLVGKAVGFHQGQLGSLKISVEGKFSALPLLNLAVDKIEELIPGDQKIYAQIIKEQIAKIKIKF